MFHQLHMRDIIRMRLPQVKKHILQLMRNSRDIVKHHNSGRTLDGMHGPENLIDAVFVKAIRILLFQNRLLKLFQQLGVLKQIHIQHAFRIKIFSHILLLSSLISVSIRDFSSGRFRRFPPSPYTQDRRNLLICSEPAYEAGSLSL